MATHSPVAVPSGVWTKVAALAAGASISLTNPGELRIEVSTVETDATAPSGDAACDFVGAHTTVVYDDPDGVDLYVRAPVAQSVYVR